MNHFPTTRLSVVAALKSADHAERGRAWDRLVEHYWKPAYKYIRLKWNASEEDAQDWTQAFFARAYEKDFFSGFDPARASFHTFLRLCLDGFVANQKKAAAAQKRGGGTTTISFDFVTAEGELKQHQVPDGMTLEDYFDREWKRTLFELSIDELRRDCQARGRPVHFALFERYDLESSENPSYASLAAEYGIPVTTVTNHLAATRREFRRIVLERLREMTGSEAEFRAAARSLLGRDL